MKLSTPLIAAPESILALALVAAAIHPAQAHIFLQQPEARSCFYGGYWGSDGDGPWRRSPCDRDPDAPTATYVAGTSTCLSLHEFVPHPAHYDIQLFPEPVGPGMDNVQGIFLAQNVEDLAPSDETGYQRFWVDLPPNVTFQDSCTIQVRQFVCDYDWCLVSLRLC